LAPTKVRFVVSLPKFHYNDTPDLLPSTCCGLVSETANYLDIVVGRVANKSVTSWQLPGLYGEAIGKRALFGAVTKTLLTSSKHERTTKIKQFSSLSILSLLGLLFFFFVA